MPFRLWFYFTKMGSFVLFAIILASFVAPGESIFGGVRFIATSCFLIFCLAGAVMGILMVLGRLKMRCPFCNKSGLVGGSKQDGMWMECETCGLVHGSGPLGLKIVRTEIRDDDDRADD